MLIVVKNELFLYNNGKIWIKEVSSKFVKKVMEGGYTDFTRFFKGKSSVPKFKKKEKSDVKMPCA